MKNASLLKAHKSESPKTPGGISKSLLTPCRRVGLSRNWRKGGLSPFVSPLSGTGEGKQEAQIKRKIDDIDSENPKTNDSDIKTTPSRNVNIPRRKKSKILSAVIEPVSPVTKCCESEETATECTTVNSVPSEVLEDEVVTTPISKTNSNIKIPSSPQDISTGNTIFKKSPTKGKDEICDIMPQDPINSKEESVSDVKITPNNVAKLKNRKFPLKNKKKSPENLTKECVIVIQRKIFKKDLIESEQNDKSHNIEEKSTSQVLFDSDSDDVPLSLLNKNETESVEKQLDEINFCPAKDNVQILKIQPKSLVLNEDDDFVESNKVNVHKLEDKATSTSTLKKNAKKKPKENKKPVITVKELQPSSQSSDDDDFDFNRKKTILIRRSYDKVTKPTKAKSTGSVTQRDIDELRSRIEVKKKLLLAKVMNNDTEELRELIKKWRKGCQDALSELMELMRKKIPDKQNMEFSEMLQTLKIPTSLVGYDEENDCFNTPDDKSIVLAKFNDI